MQIHIVADFICPWCYIGKRQFELAHRQRPDIELRVQWLPFLINPELPREGMDRRDYLTAKFGSPEAKDMHDQLRAFAEPIGLEMNFDAIKRVPNTISAHTLARWAGEAGVQEQVVEALFRANFVEGRDIGENDVLCAIAEEAGMDGTEVRRRLDQAVDRYDVIMENQMLRNMGVKGVPCILFERRLVVSGAQGVDGYVQALDQAALLPQTTEQVH